MAEEPEQVPESALQGAVRRAREQALANRSGRPNEIERANRSDEPALRRPDGTLAGSAPAPASWLEE